MANTFLLKIITPSHEVFNGEVQKVFLRNSDGSFEILANHEIISIISCGTDFSLFILTFFLNSVTSFSSNILSE